MLTAVVLADILNDEETDEDSDLLWEVVALLDGEPEADVDIVVVSVCDCVDDGVKLMELETVVENVDDTVDDIDDVGVLI